MAMCWGKALGQDPQRKDTSKPKVDSNRISPADTAVTGNDSLRFPITDRRGDKLNYPRKNSFDLKDPSNIADSLVYDPATKSYYIIEKIGNSYYRKPGSISFDEYMRLKSDQMERIIFMIVPIPSISLTVNCKTRLKVHTGLLTDFWKW
jgi:hypothetical protein